MLRPICIPIVLDKVVGKRADGFEVSAGVCWILDKNLG